MTAVKQWTHADLCTIAVKWLKRANSNNGHGCHVAVSEVRSGWTGEIPDAIGFRQSGYAPSDGSVVVEVKVSRSDFLADKKKPHRIDGGLGNWRYYMCPEGMIQPEELPEGWGLLWVNSRGHVKPKAGFAGALADSKNYHNHQEALASYRHESDWLGEQFILVKLYSRIGDAEELNQKMREAWAEQSRLSKRVNTQNETIRRLERELRMARRGNPSAIAELTASLGGANA
ncbi:Phage protein [Halomonas citrativorans]|uniref:Phage protein n=1 Tax=Halomonas citrativorans TaxID=2742612 RepID=A0A1R4I5E2_9GAMM|nr:adenylosuccinate synthase [Halomonas citrativorans]SJN14844.1 Phage protein [Halomonas citrativorans]